MRRAPRNDEQRPRLEVLAFATEPHRAASFDDELDLIGVPVDVLADVARLDRERGVVGHDQRFGMQVGKGGCRNVGVLERREIDDRRGERRGCGVRIGDRVVHQR